MIVVGYTITGAASGEDARTLQRRRVHNLRQKDRRITNVYLLYLLMLMRLEPRRPSLFFL